MKEIIDFYNHCKKYIKWFIIVTTIILLTDLSFTMMNQDSTLLFIIGVFIVVMIIAFIIFIFKSKQTKQQ